MTSSRLSLAVAAAVSVTYFSTLSDTPRRLAVALPTASAVAPPVAADEPGPRGRVQIEVTDEQGALVASASVRVFALRGEQAFAAGQELTDDEGRATVQRVPLGEAWVLVEGEGRQRASLRVTLRGEGAQAKLVLRKAQRLVVQAVDENERAVAGAQVEVRGGDPLPFVGKSGADGAVEFARLGPGPWSVRASAPGYEPVQRSGVAAGLLPQRVTLRSLGALEVTVVGADGAPADGAEVEVAGSGLWPARHAVTGDEGKVRVAALPAGAYDVVGSKGELMSETSIGTPVRRGEPTAVRLVLGQGRRVAVRVMDGEGDEAKPVEKAEVVLAEEGLSSFPRRALTDERGGAVLGPLGRRSAALGVRAEGFVARSGVRVSADERGPLVVALVRGGLLLGEVVDTRGDPVSGAAVEVIGVDFAGMPVDETPERTTFKRDHFAWALAAPAALIPAGELGVMPGPLPPIPHGKAGLVGWQRPGAPAAAASGAAAAEAGPLPWVSRESGEFRAGPVPPGRLRALVRHPGYVEGLSEAATVAPGSEVRVRVVLRAGGTIEGRVLDRRGQPVAGARVEMAAVHGATVRSVMTDEGGSFAFAAVPGEVSVSVSRPDGPGDVALRKAVDVGEGERKELELTLPEAREPVEVRVVDERGNPLDNAQVTALSLSVASPLRATRFTRDDGLVSIPDAAGLPLRFEVSLSGYAPRVETVDSAGRELRVALGKAASVEGEITTRSGRDWVEGATVTVRAGSLTRTARTDAQGRFSLRGLPPGPARVSVQAKGYARAEQAVQIKVSEWDRPTELDRIDLSEGGEVEGEVVDRRGEPVIGARVAQGVVPAFLPLGPLPAGIVVTDAQGRFKLADLPEGPVDLEAFAPSLGRGRAVAVQITAGRTQRSVRIVLDTDTAQDDPTASGGVAVTLAENSGEGARVVVRAVAAGSEAERAGLEAGDELLAVDDHEPSRLEEARRWLAGPVGEDVVLRVRRQGQEQKLLVARERVRR